MKFQAISPTAVDKAWPELSPGLEKAMKYSLSSITTDDVKRNVADGSWLMFTLFDEGEPVVSLVAMIRQGQERIFDVGYCWGTRLNDWLTDVYLMFEVVAKQCGCDKMAFNGRPGWSKLAHNHGFRVNSITFTKEL